MADPSHICLYLAVALVTLLVVLISKRRRSPEAAHGPGGALRLPPGPWQLPVIGSLHHLAGQLPHRAMRDLARRYGPVMMLRLGEVPTLVVSSRDAAREVMKTHDTAFSTRPLTATRRVLTNGGKDIALAPYGDYWRQVRRIAVTELLSARRVLSFRSIREEEVAATLRAVAKAASAGRAVEMRAALSALVSDSTARAVMGDRCKDRDVFLRAVDRAVELCCGFNLPDLWPSSSRLTGCLSGVVREAEECRDTVFGILDGIIQEHLQKTESGVGVAAEDLIDVLLRIRRVGSSSRSTWTPLKQSSFAGSETSSTTLGWAIAELIRNPKAMQKATSEVRRAFASYGAVSEVALGELHYLNLVIRETFRLHPPATLLLPRECREPCQVLGYDVPQGTQVFVNVWAIGRDERYWPDYSPEEFLPERFNDGEAAAAVDFRGANFELLPFGAGRRMCAGMAFGLANVELPLASLLFHFDWEVSGLADPTDLDMTETFGVTVRRKSNLLLRPILRMPVAKRRQMAADTSHGYFYVGFALLSLFVIQIARRRRSPASHGDGGGLRLPPGPWQLPVIGSLHHLVGKLPHRAMRDLARRYGPVMMLRLGEVPTLVISSRDAAREVMKTHDVAFATRPLSATMRVLSSGGRDIVFAPYGDYWRQVRKIAVVELLSARRVQSFRSIREEEVAALLRTVATMRAAITALVSDITARVVFGNRCDDRDEFLVQLDRTIELAAGFNPADLWPSSRIASRLSGFVRRAEECRNKVFEILDGIIQEHLEMTEKDGAAGEDLIDVLLRIQKEGGLQFPLTMGDIKAIIFDIFNAGSETSGTTLAWAMAELLRNPTAMKKATDERMRSPTSINYLRLVIRETLRLHPPLPLLLPRECRKACQVLGYDVPRGTQVLVNAWALGHDERYWPGGSPEEFRPERFDDGEPAASVDFRGADFEVLPFGSGRRMCPGMAFGLANVEFPLASLLFHFDWEVPSVGDPANLDMAEAFGITARRKANLDLRPHLNTSHGYVYVGLALLSLLVVLIARRRRSPAAHGDGGGLRMPPGPWQLPVIGSLHHLVGKLPHSAMRDLARRHGPVMTLRLGEVPTLVVSSRDAAREVMKTHDVAFATRPLSTTIHALSSDGRDLAFAPYGDYWRQVRKIAVTELLTVRRVHSFRPIREEEVAAMLRAVAAAAADDGRRTVEMRAAISALVSDITARAVFGNRCDKRDEFLVLVDRTVELAVGFNPADLWPSSRLAHRLTGFVRRAEECRSKVFEILDCIIREHLEMTDKDGAGGEDLIDVLLRIQKEGGLQFPLGMDDIKAIIFDIFSAGSETSGTTLAWAMAELLRNPTALEKATTEVRRAFAATGARTRSSTSVTCISIVIRETLQLHPPLPLLLPRECREACRVLGYDVPRGTQVLVNAWALGRDEHYWSGSSPEQFQPERFGDGEPAASVDFRGANFELLPFGSGRRMCPGMAFGLANVEFPLASLLFHFDWEVPSVTDPAKLDMTEAFGTTARRKANLDLCPTRATRVFGCIFGAGGDTRDQTPARRRTY
uniref:Cytochrome P450 n=1 Tax=Leersia perrieri TaxID=77586 RepID=A0A0D9WSH0_9ORYZ